MSDLNFNNNIAIASQPQNQTAQSSSPYAAFGMQTSPAMQGESYDKFKSELEARSKDNALAQATKDYDVMEHPGVLLKNWLLCVAMSMGFTGLTNHLMQSKDILPGITNTENFKQTRLYQAGDFLDNKVSKSSVGKFLGKIGDSIKSVCGKIPVPNFVKEIYGKMKMGSICVLDKTGMYTIGKGAEALNEFMEYVSRVPEAELQALDMKNSKEVIKVIKDFKAGRIRGPIAFEKVAKFFADVPADKLANLNAGGRGLLDKLLKTTPNINLSLNKARFFNGAYNTAQGPIAKGMQKLSALIGEATGGGVLGGKMALLMNTVGLMTGFNAASNAEKGDKLKAFMEDYIGFTLGSYLMSFYVGTWFNKSLGVAELGLDKKAVETVGKKLGIDMTAGRLQDVVIAFNKAYRLSMAADNFRNGSISFEAAMKKAAAYGVEGADKAKTPAELLEKIGKTLKGRTTKDLDLLRGEIDKAFKSKLTFTSIFKETPHNKGNFLTRAARYLVQKPLSLLGRILSIGRYDMLSGPVGSAKGLAKFAKRFGGGFGRALLVLFVLVEPFRKGFIRLSHMIFGKPKHSALDEEDNEKKKAAEKSIKDITELPPEVMPSNRATAVPQTAKRPVVITNNREDTKLLNNILNKKSAQPMAAASIAASKMKEDDIDTTSLPEIKRTYIPTSTPVKIENEETDRELAAQKMFEKCDRAEKRMMKYLK